MVAASIHRITSVAHFNVSCNGKKRVTTKTTSIISALFHDGMLHAPYATPTTVEQQDVHVCDDDVVSGQMETLQVCVPVLGRGSPSPVLGR